MEGELAAAAECEPEWRDYDRKWCEAQRHRARLKEANGFLELLPFPVPHHAQHPRQIGPRRERARIVIADHEPVQSRLRDTLQRLVQHAQHAFAERVHLARELECGDAITEVDQRSVLPCGEHAPPALLRGQMNRARQLRHRPRAPIVREVVDFVP